MNANAVCFLHRHAALALAPVVLLFAACASEPYQRPPAAPAPNLAGTHWTVTSIDGRDTLPETRLTADFSADGRVNGDSGCNNFSGSFVQNGATVNFGELLSTRRACVESSRQLQEDRMLDIMRGGATARLMDEGEELSLRSSAGTMTLERTMATTASLRSRSVQYDCQGVPLTVDYIGNSARLSWPDGNDVVRLESDDDDRVIRYESARSELRIERDILWGREGAPPRSCVERQ